MNNQKLLNSATLLALLEVALSVTGCGAGRLATAAIRPPRRWMAPCIGICCRIAG